MHTRTLFYGALVVLAITSLATAQGQNGASESKEPSFLAILRSDAPGAQKALACKNLAIHGTEAAVPDLAPLLSDEKLASWALIALEAIPGPAVDEALRKAAESLAGRQLVGVIQTLGVRRDAQAVATLTTRLQDQDAEVAVAAAIALGTIGDPSTTKALQGALADTRAPVRSAVAEGLILSAEQLLAQDKSGDAAEIYDAVRQADVPKPRLQEALRGAILARKSEGIPLLLESLRSEDRGMYLMGLAVAREAPGEEISAALAKELGSAPPARAALLVAALGDRNDPSALPAILAVMKDGAKEVRLAAMEVVGRLGNETSIGTLLAMATEADAEVAKSARDALTSLSGDKVNGEIAARLAAADGKTLPVLIELVGQRRIEATSALVQALNHSQANVRSAALLALGETVGQDQLSILIAQAVKPKQSTDAADALKALRAAAVRMPDREAAAAEVAAALSGTPVATQANLLETLGAMGGQKALKTLTAAVKGNEDSLRDTSSRLLGEWMSTDAAPDLLDLAKTAPTDKYRVRALRGYIRLARQFTIPDAERAAMCQNALAAATRPDEQALVIPVLERYPSLDMLKVAVQAAKIPAVKQDATRAALVIAQKVEQKDAARQLLDQIGLPPMKIEIVKATYGAGSTQKDVTEILKRHTGEYPVIVLPNANYSNSLGGDPIPGTPKKLQVQYRMDGKAGTVSFAENEPIVLPLPKE